MKYIFSNDCKQAFTQVKVRVGEYVNKVPSLVPYYEKVKIKFLWTLSQAGGGCKNNAHEFLIVTLHTLFLFLIEIIAFLETMTIS